MSAELDNRVRMAVYEGFVDEGEPPSAAQVADALGIPTQEVKSAFGRLDEAHVIVLMAGTSEIWMANPLSAVATGFADLTGGYRFLILNRLTIGVASRLPARSRALTRNTCLPGFSFL